MKIGVGGDHAGYGLKGKVCDYLKEHGYEVVDYGTHSEESVDYPDYIHPLAIALEKGEIELGIIMCGSGNGVNITANKHQGVRSALCWNPELAEMAKLHNNANVLALAARYVDEKVNLKSVEVFLNTEFEGGRHLNRVNKIACS